MICQLGEWGGTLVKRRKNNSMRKTNSFCAVIISLIIMSSCANGEVYIYAGYMDYPGEWVEHNGVQTWCYYTNCIIIACLDKSVHFEIHDAVANLPLHELTEFIPFYPTEVFYIWEIDGTTTNIVAWHMLKRMDFYSYICSNSTQVIFPNTELCHSIGRKIVDSIDGEMSEEQKRHLPACFQIAEGVLEADLKSKVRNLWRNIKGEVIKPVEYWMKTVGN